MIYRWLKQSSVAALDCFVLKVFPLLECCWVRFEIVTRSLLKNELLTETKAATDELRKNAGCPNLIRFIPWNLDVCRCDRRCCLIHNQFRAVWDFFRQCALDGNLCCVGSVPISRFQPCLCIPNNISSIPASLMSTLERQLTAGDHWLLC